MISGKKYKEMTEEFLHGVNVIELTSGAKAVRTAKSSVIGVIGTAPEADEQKFPLNKPVLITGSLKEAAKTWKEWNTTFCSKWNIFPDWCNSYSN
jgi:Phage tail sheath protein FI